MRFYSPIRNILTKQYFINLNSLLSPGGTKRGGDDPDHPASAQGAASLPAAAAQEGGGEPAARQGGVHHQVRHERAAARALQVSVFVCSGC